MALREVSWQKGQMLSPHGQPTGTQLREKVPRLTQADRFLFWELPGLTFLICTWKAAPPRGGGWGWGAGCMRPEPLIQRSENKMHIHPQGQDRARKGNQKEIIFCFHTYPYTSTVTL